MHFPFYPSVVISYITAAIKGATEDVWLPQGPVPQICTSTMEFDKPIDEMVQKKLFLPEG